MARVLKINEGITEGVKKLLRHLLEEKKVRAVLTLRREEQSGTVSYCLITDSEKIKEAVPLYPVMPNNAGKLLSVITSKEPFSEPVAVVLRPCEIRAFVELVKRRQGSMDNVVTISSICTGVYPLKRFAREEIDKQLDNYFSAASGEEPVPGIRDTCRACEYFLPTGADIIVAVAGEKNIDSECKLFIITEKGAELVEGLEGEREEAELETEKTALIRSRRHEEKEKLYGEIKELLSGLDGIVEVFSSCTGCHGCSAVCPICYCRLCEFDSLRSEYKPETYETELHKRGGVRIPPGTVTFHIGRLSHIAISCVGCGMCSDVCPADIPVAGIFTKVGDSVQKLFQYIPGRDSAENIPITTFEELELSEVED